MRSDHVSNSSRAGGVAILLPKGWKSIRIHDFDKFKKESLDIIVSLLFTPASNTPLKLAVIYNHPNNKIPPEILKEFHALKHNNQTVHGWITGDLNSPNEAWGSRTTNASGLHLQQVIEDMGFHILNNPEQPTYMSTSTGAPNILDLFICHSNSLCVTGECTTHGDIGSDHLPVNLELSIKAPAPPPTFKKVTDWQKFRSKLATTQTNEVTVSKEAVDAEIESLSSLIKEAFSDATTSRKVKMRNGFQLKRETSRWIETRRKLLKIKSDPLLSEEERRLVTTIYNRSNRKVRALLKIEDTLYWEKVAQTVASAPDVSSKWKAVKRLTGSESRVDTPLKDPTTGNLVVTPEEIVEIHASRLEQTHTPANHPAFDQSWRSQTEEWSLQNPHLLKPLESPITEANDEELPPTTVSEIQNFITSARLKSAPGEDGLTYLMLRNIPTNILLRICLIFNHCLLLGYFPSAWKRATLVMIPKEGKDHKESKNHRPISLLSTVGKLFEKVIRCRFVKSLEKRNLINKYQSGYQKRRGTLEQLLRLTEDIHTAFKSRKCTLAAFLDVAGAFDRVWHNGLRKKMSLCKLPPKTTRIISSFIDDRRIQVKAGDTFSREIIMRAGTAQGSCLSPDIYNFYTFDSVDPDAPVVEPSQYADDTAGWTSSRRVSDAADKMQQFLRSLELWCCKWRMQLAPEKTQIILFSRCPSHKRDDVKLYLFGDALQISREAKFLGVTFDDGLRWRSHVLALVAKARGKIQFLRRVAALQRGKYPKCIMSLFDSLIRSTIEYSAPCLLAMSSEFWEKLERIYSEAQRVALHLPRYVPLRILREASGRGTLREHLTNFSVRRLLSVKHQSPTFAATLERRSAVRDIFTNKSPLEYVEDALGAPLPVD
jgi:DNA-binding MarR family transcriptional regulator